MRILVLFVLLLSLSACAHLSNSPLPTASTTPQTWKTREQQLAAIKHWQINGKIAVQSAQEAGTATVSWMQNGSGYHIALIGPLGANSLTIQGEPGHVVLSTANGKQYVATSAETLLEQQWQFRLPVSNLYYWIRGLPAPNSTHHDQFDTAGRMSQLTQQGWSIQYLTYTHIGQVDLPSKLSLVSPTLKVKMVIYAWNTY